MLLLGAGGALAESGAAPGRPAAGRDKGSDPDEAEAAFDVYDYRPTVGITGGLWSGGLPFGLPTDQRPDDAYSLTYTTAALTGPVEIVGRPRAVLHVRSTAPVMAFVARLCDVAPDGTSALVCKGVLNGTRRASLTRPEPLDPNETYELTVELDCTAWRFEPGHRIRLAVCSADFPNVWPTPIPGTNRLYRGPRAPSRLHLPVVPTGTGADAPSAPPPACTEPDGVYRLSPREAPWELVHDVLGDRVGLNVRTLDVVRPDDASELTFDERLELWASNRDPADVTATGRHHRQIVRRDGVTVVDTDCTVRSTQTTFHVTLQLQVLVNGLLFHQRKWVRTFPRALL